jgi:hypothetical protein
MFQDNALQERRQNALAVPKIRRICKGGRRIGMILTTLLLPGAVDSRNAGEKKI